MTDVLVTGARGFVGNHLVKALGQRNISCIEVTRENGEISDRSTWDELPPSDVVVHLAAKTFVPESWKNPEAFYSTNIGGTLQALEYCRKHSARMVMLSSYLYGMPDQLPIPETAPIRAVNPYMFSKKTAEESCRFYAEAFGVSCIVLRVFNIYGPGQNDDFLVPTIVNQAVQGDEIVVNDLTPKRDYLHITDLISAIVSAIHSDLEFEIMNIASGVSFSVEDVIRFTQSASGRSIPVKSRGIVRENEIMDTVADVSKAERVMGWSPTITLEDGIAMLVEHYEKKS